MQAHTAPSSRASALAYPKATATNSSRPNQRQMGTDTERGQSLALGMCRLALAVAYVQDRPALTLRAGITSPCFPTSRGFGPGAFHCRSAAGISPHSRRPVLDTLLSGIGLNSPAERIRAARGAFHSVHGFGANRPHAQSLAHQQTVNVSADVPHIQPRLSSKSALRPDQYGRSEKGWRYQIPVMRCPT